jgi:hypothetical protein
MSSKIASTPYAVGYIDAGHGNEDGLKEIELKNKAGKFQSSLEAGPAGIGAAASAAIDAKVMPTSPLNDFSAVSLHNQGGDTTWPIVAISYIYVRRDLTSLGDKACLLKAFMEFIISDEGQALLPAFGAVGIPPAVKKIAQNVIDFLKMPPCKQWAFEGSSTQKGTGQADHILSAKRRHFYEYDDSVSDATVTSLKADVTALQATPMATVAEDIAALKAKIAKLEDSGIDAVSVVSLVVAGVAILLSVLLPCVLKGRGGGQLADVGGSAIGKSNV